MVLNDINIHAEITGIRYKTKLFSQLKNISINDLDINNSPSAFILSESTNHYGVSKWVSPKRTRSYPYARIYDTMSISKRITIIPVVKDEGIGGDRDFLQWDTISLMSLFDTYVILAYYEDADRHKKRSDKITNQRFNNNFIKNKIMEISNYRSSALHWNMQEMKVTLSEIIKKVITSYGNLEKKYNIQFKSIRGLEKFESMILSGYKDFMNFSRDKAINAQHREMMTTQPKEYLQTLTKATITIKNYLGGFYYFTTDEIKIIKGCVELIECKHSKRELLPSLIDIKDGLLKMILYCNLSDVFIGQQKYNPKPVLLLSSNTIQGNISSSDSDLDINMFIDKNGFTKKRTSLIKQLFLEAKNNNFEVRVTNGVIK